MLGENSQKMSKSRGNVVNPDTITSEYGADTFRVYEMFMGPFTDMKPWSTASIEGTYRFLQKIWRLSEKPMTGDEENSLTVMLHKTIKKVGNDIESLSFNTAISQLMIFTNALGEKESMYQPYFETLLRLLSPFAPHIAEELWHKLGHDTFIVQEVWPQYEDKFLIEDEIEVPVQVNGKVRDVLKVSTKATKEDVLAMAKASPAIAKWLETGELAKEIYVQGKMVNLVVKN